MGLCYLSLSWASARMETFDKIEWSPAKANGSGYEGGIQELGGTKYLELEEGQL